MSQHEFVSFQPVTAPPPVADVAPAMPATEVDVVRPSGPPAAAVLAAGIGCFALGLLSVLTAASASISSALTLSDRVGDLSGVTIGASLVFVASWALLGTVWRHADPPLERVAIAAGGLVALGVLGTFPPFFNAVG